MQSYTVKPKAEKTTSGEKERELGGGVNTIYLSYQNQVKRSYLVKGWYGQWDPNMSIPGFKRRKRVQINKCDI